MLHCHTKMGIYSSVVWSLWRVDKVSKVSHVVQSARFWNSKVLVSGSHRDLVLDSSKTIFSYTLLDEDQKRFNLMLCTAVEQPGTFWLDWRGIFVFVEGHTNPYQDLLHGELSYLRQAVSNLNHAGRPERLSNQQDGCLWRWHWPSLRTVRQNVSASFPQSFQASWETLEKPQEPTNHNLTQGQPFM